MRLRQLEQRDAELMLQWMHDKDVVDKLQTNFMSKTLDDCRYFIESSNNQNNLHLAVVDDEDIYMGTVSLKHITNESAEFAITICKAAMGKGYAIWAMREIIRIGFEKIHLKYIYWCVASNNLRAIKFYDKNGFCKISSKQVKMAREYTQQQIDSYVWYKIVNATLKQRNSN